MSDENTTAAVDYEVTQAREILGQMRKIGERVSLHTAQAKYYLSPLGSGLKPVAAKGAKPDAPSKPADKPSGK